MTSARKDNPGVIVPPPLIPLAAFVLGLCLDRLVPLHALQSALGFGARVVLGFALAAAGLSLVVAGALFFSAEKTNIPPWKPALSLVTTGIYGRMRNPMYVGFGFVTAGLAAGFASGWTLLLMIPAALVLHYGVVLREERYLEAKFGEDYRRYLASVPRYGWR